MKLGREVLEFAPELAPAKEVIVLRLRGHEALGARRTSSRFGAALANAHRLLKHPNTYLDVTFEGDHCCFRLGRPGDLDHIFCALPIIDRPSAGQPGLLKTLALLEWR